MVSERIYQVKNYQLLEELSRGGMGVVYKARDIHTNKAYALKFMLPGSDEESKTRFLREAKALSLLEHPNILPIIEFGEDRGLPFIVMELIQGESLSKHVQASLHSSGEAPSYSWTVSVFKKIAEGLKACHDRGLCHRDIKPDNILIEKDSQNPILIDFGLVKMDKDRGQLDSLSNLTKSGDILGTPYFMSPEQFDSKECGQIGPHTDIWSLGSTLFYCLTGKAPYEGESLVNIYNKVVVGEPPTITAVDNRVPERLVTLCSMCMKKESSKRISATEIIELLSASDQEKSLIKPILGGLIILIILLLTAALALKLQTPEAPPDFLQSSKKKTETAQKAPAPVIKKKEARVADVLELVDYVNKDSLQVVAQGIQELEDNSQERRVQNLALSSKHKELQRLIERVILDWTSLLQFLEDHELKSEARRALKKALTPIFADGRFYILKWQDPELYKKIVKLGQKLKAFDRLTLEARAVEIQFEEAKDKEQFRATLDEVDVLWKKLLRNFSRIARQKSEDMRALRQTVFEVALIKIRCEKHLGLHDKAQDTLNTLKVDRFNTRGLFDGLQDRLTGREYNTLDKDLQAFQWQRANKEGLRRLQTKLNELVQDESGKHRPYAYPLWIQVTLRYTQLLTEQERQVYVASLALESFEYPLYWQLMTSFNGRTKLENLLFLPSYFSAARDLAALLAMQGKSKSAARLLRFSKDLCETYKHPLITKIHQDIEEALSKQD